MQSLVSHDSVHAQQHMPPMMATPHHQMAFLQQGVALPQQGAAALQQHYSQLQRNFASMVPGMTVAAQQDPSMTALLRAYEHQAKMHELSLIMVMREMAKEKEEALSGRHQVPGLPHQRDRHYFDPSHLHQGAGFAQQGQGAAPRLPPGYQLPPAFASMAHGMAGSESDGVKSEPARTQVQQPAQKRVAEEGASKALMWEDESLTAGVTSHNNNDMNTSTTAGGVHVFFLARYPRREGLVPALKPSPFCSSLCYPYSLVTPCCDAGKRRNAKTKHGWRKYGQKLVKAKDGVTLLERAYYKCTVPDCPVKKMVSESSPPGSEAHVRELTPDPSGVVVRVSGGEASACFGFGALRDSLREP